MLGGRPEALTDLVVGLSGAGVGVTLLGSEDALLRARERLFGAGASGVAFHPLPMPKPPSWTPRSLFVDEACSYLADFSASGPLDVDLLDLQHPGLWTPGPAFPSVYSTNYSWSYAAKLLTMGEPAYSAPHFLKCFMERRAVRNSKGVIVETRSQLAEMSRAYQRPNEDFFLRPPGIRTDDVDWARRSAASGRDGLFTIGYSGRIERLKGIMELAYGASEFARRSGKRVRLLLVGGGPLVPWVEATCARSGLNVEVTGRLPRRSALARLAESDVFVMPSHIETFSLSTLEAMALGLPVIATSAVPPELVADRVTGLRVEPRDAAAIARALLEVSSDPGLRESLAEGAKSTGSRYTLTRFVEGTIEAYRRVLSR
ncbi:MAG: glycosyltransferase family 4 protein [Nitrososphaerota archaeon]|nr:glycosyltransferase family 4 protein [Nitrososphaerota archaeon]